MVELGIIVACGIALAFWGLLMAADWFRLARTPSPERRYLDDEEYRRTFEETEPGSGS